MTYDRLARVTLATIARPGSGATNFFGILYDTLDRRTETFRGSSFTTYSYDTSSRPNSISQNFYGGAGNVTKGFSYDAANEITSQTRNNDDYRFSGYATINRGYTTNALNQYTAAGSATFTYDLNGNLTSDGTNTYGYDAENRMTSASTSGGTTLTYDPLGRLYQTSSATFGITQFAYDGAHVVVEYNGGTGAIRRRFFWGPGADEPILQDEGGQWDCSGTKFLHTDDLGSVIAAAECWGNRISVNTYDEYGIPAASNWGRFHYTGQALIPDLGMYYYKARFYSPTLGRFMQTDPIGYNGGMNLYAYVSGDPVNGTDPLGLEESIGSITVFSCGCIRGDAASAVVSQTISVMSNFLQGLNFNSGPPDGLVSGKSPQSGHDYRTNDKVCRRALSSAEAKDLMTRFAVPSVFSGDPVGNGEYLVTNGFGAPGGIVQTTFAANGLSATNVTTPVHAFVGTIVRSAGVSGGATYIATHGFGNAGSDAIGRLRDENNAKYGPGIFNQLDSRAAGYAAGHYPGC